MARHMTQGRCLFWTRWLSGMRWSSKVGSDLQVVQHTSNPRVKRHPTTWPGSGGYCSPRPPTHFASSFLDLNGSPCNVRLALCKGPPKEKKPKIKKDDSEVAAAAAAATAAAAAFLDGLRTLHGVNAPAAAVPNAAASAAPTAAAAARVGGEKSGRVVQVDPM
jgi:hypothetical protein